MERPDLVEVRCGSTVGGGRCEKAHGRWSLISDGSVRAIDRVTTLRYVTYLGKGAEGELVESTKYRHGCRRCGTPAIVKLDTIGRLVGEALDAGRTVAYVND